MLVYTEEKLIHVYSVMVFRMGPLAPATTPLLCMYLKAETIILISP